MLTMLYLPLQNFALTGSAGTVFTSIGKGNTLMKSGLK
jgi:hypothetical protein